MSAAITLISANEIVNGGIVRPVPLNSRFDSQLLATNIPTAEERFLLPVLCRSFYADLIAQKTTDESNYNINVVCKLRRIFTYIFVTTKNMTSKNIFFMLKKNELYSSY